MASLSPRLAPLLGSLLLLAGCNEIVGLSSLEKADCLPDCDAGEDPLGTVWLGRGHSCITTMGQSLHCFGANGNGQLGDGTTTDRATPIKVAGVEEVAFVALGLVHTCVVRSDGTVWCWGGNARGQLGDGTTTDHTEPALVKGLLGSALKVQAGEEHTCTEMVDGTVWCWGGNSDGQVGDGTTTDRPTPTKVELPSTIKKLSSGGGNHTCGALNDGTVWCWGLNDKWQLGNETMPSSSVPVQVAGLSGVKKTSNGRQYSCALLGDGSAQCWGANDFGQLGDTTTNQRATPAPIIGVADVGALAAGNRHMCATSTSSNALKCWGANDHGQLGLGEDTAPFLTEPTLVPDFIVLYDAAGTKGEHTCAIKEDGNLYCWGWNDSGQLGDGTTTDRFAPTLVKFQ